MTTIPSLVQKLDYNNQTELELDIDHNNNQTPSIFCDHITDSQHKYGSMTTIPPLLHKLEYRVKQKN